MGFGKARTPDKPPEAVAEAEAGGVAEAKDDAAGEEEVVINMSEQEEPTITAMRKVFYRMGLDDRDLVALLCGGHVYGRCHPELR